MVKSKRELVPLVYGMVVIMMSLAVVITGCKQTGESPTVKSPSQTVSEKVRVEYYIMSKCPFGVSVEDAIHPVLEKMGGDIDFSLDFIGTFDGSELVSLHGEPEVKGDKVQLCAMKYAPGSYMDMVVCMNKNWQQIPGNWESCAKETNMPIDKLKACYEGREGHELLKASFERSRQRRARGSPIVYINGKHVRVSKNEAGFTRAICEAFTKDKPKHCVSVPPPSKVPITIISDQRCKKCRIDMIEQQMEKFFEGAETKVLDFASGEGKKLYTDLNLKKLPVLLFGQEVKEQFAYVRFQQVLEPKGDYLVCYRYSFFDPTREICDNKKDDTGNNKVDCDDPQCKNNLTCRKEIPKKLELFVMSQCPYGVRALDAMKEVLDNFKNNIDFEVHFIATEMEAGRFSALHGQPEVDENIRELCAVKHHSKNYKYMDYIWCRNKNIHNTNWQTCTGESAGIKKDIMEKCFSGEQGKHLLSDDIKIAEGLGVATSPTWFANNKYRFAGIDPETIKTNLCQYNKGLKGCENTLSGPKAQTAGGSCR